MRVGCSTRLAKAGNSVDLGIGNELVGNSPSLLGKVERYQLDLAHLYAVLALEPNSLTDGGCPTLELSRVRGWGYSFRFTAVDERVASMQRRRKHRLLYTLMPLIAEYSPFLKKVGEVLDKAPPTDSIVLLGYFNTHFSNDCETEGA